jgi:polyhydroxyalkanoate synthase
MLIDEESGKKDRSVLGFIKAIDLAETSARTGRFAKEEARRSFLRASNLVERILLGPLTPSLSTPSKVEFWWEKSKLVHYSSARYSVRHKVPLLITPPLMVRPTIFDLRAGHSFVAYLLNCGFDVFILDLGVPGREDAVMSVDDYILDFIPQAVQKIREKTRQDRVSLLGWSMGGIMNVCYNALNADDANVKNLICIGSPVDYSKMFPINIMTKLGYLPFKRFIDLVGNVPGFLSSTAFKLTAPGALITRYFELAYHYWDRSYIAGFEALETWMNVFIPYPAEALMQFATDFIKDDKLKTLQIEMGGRTLDMKAIKSNVLVVAGTTDFIAPPPSCTALLDFVSSRDKSKVLAKMGHLGLVAGSHAPEEVWAPIADWLSKRSS